MVEGVWRFAVGWPVLARANEKARNVRVATFTCASDVFNRDDNRYSFEPWTNRPAIAEAARGNYAINGGTHNPRYTADNAAQPHGDGLSLEHGPGVFRFVGSGVAGINRAFRVEDFTNGQSTLVAMDEIRAGIHRLDPRGVWSLGQIGGSITWGHEAEEFCRRLGDLPDEKAAHRRYRLPSEAEWEYACRSGKCEPYRWMPQRRPDDRSGAAAGIAPPLPLAKVGSYPPNAFGLYDLRGNVWEWCADWFDRSYYRRSPRVDPPGPAKGFLKVARGGDWIFVGEPCHINYSIMPPWKRSPYVGFRVVCSGMGQKRTHAKPIARHN